MQFVSKFVLLHSLHHKFVTRVGIWVFLIWGQILKHTFCESDLLKSFHCTKNCLMQSFVAKFWCLDVAQWSQSWLNKHWFMHIGSFLISTIIMFTESYCCVRVDFFIFETMAWLISTICKAYCINIIIFLKRLDWGVVLPSTQIVGGTRPPIES